MAEKTGARENKLLPVFMFNVLSRLRKLGFVLTHLRIKMKRFVTPIFLYVLQI